MGLFNSTKWYNPTPWGANSGNATGNVGVVGGLGNTITGNTTFDRNLALQMQSQEWQEHMASTNYQRTVNDLQMAGLNPVLAATGGYSSEPSYGSSTKSMGDAEFQRVLKGMFLGKVVKAGTSFMI